MAFYVVYIREAHPSDGWQMASNIREHIVFASPKSLGERDEVAGVCVRRLGLEIPALVEDDLVDRIPFGTHRLHVEVQAA